MASERNGKVAAGVPRGRGRRCPICGKPTVTEFHPFCSRRCADVDLNRWLSGAYAIASADGEEESDDGQS